MYKVLKKDGSLQDFDANKIVAGIIKAGGSQQDGEKVAKEVQEWLSYAVENETINYEDLKNKVLEICRSVNPAAAKSFEEYKK